MDNVISSYSQIYSQDNVFSLISSVANGLVCTSLVAIASDVSAQLLIGSRDNVCTEAKVFSTDKLYRKTNFFSYLIKRVTEKLDITWQYKRVVYRQDVKQFNDIVSDYGFKTSDGLPASINVLKYPIELKKSVLFKLHPDKGGLQEDFVFVKSLEEKFNKDVDVKRIIDDKIQTIQLMIYKANIGFKILDTVVDSSRLVYEPTFQNTKKVALDSTYLYSMYWGVNRFAAVITGSEALYQTYIGEYAQAFKTVATTIAYMSLPKLLTYTAVPHLGLAYGIGMAAYNGYSAVTNSYLFYLEKSSNVESMLRSTIAYKNLMQILSESPLQQLYDFATIAKGYEIEVNNITLAAEKTALKTKLDEKGKFSQKLYEYIYEPILEEKYNLLNQVLQGSITQEEAEALKAKHIKIESENTNYEHCIEIRDIGNSSNDESDIAHYYCYNEEKEMLDYIVVGNTNIQIIEHLF